MKQILFSAALAALLISTSGCKKDKILKSLTLNSVSVSNIPEMNGEEPWDMDSAPDILIQLRDFDNTLQMTSDTRIDHNVEENYSFNVAQKDGNVMTEVRTTYTIRLVESDGGAGDKLMAEKSFLPEILGDEETTSFALQGSNGVTFTLGFSKEFE